MNVRLEALKNLSLKDRLQLVGDLWDSIASELERMPISPEIQAEMERRRVEYLKDPSTGVEWDVLRRKLESRK
jgi:putative addiction module component (TIGR02574 family)